MSKQPKSLPGFLNISKKAIPWLIFFAIFLLAFYFRAVNLSSSPGWYSDEGNIIDAASHWLKGSWENYGVRGAPYIQRPPLYLYALSLVFRMGGVDINTARALSVFYSLLSLLLIFLLVRESEGDALALLAGFVYAITPWIAAFNRFALSYNQWTPCLLLVIWAALRIRRGGGRLWLWVGGLASTAAALTDYLGILAVLVFLGALIAWRRRWVIPAILILLAGGTAGILPLLLKDPALFLKDTLFTLTHRTTATAAGGTVLSLIINYGELLRSSSWILAALAGLFLLREKSLQTLLLIIVGLTLLVVMRTYTPVGVGLHYLMPLFPLLAIGLAAFIQRSFFKVMESFFTLTNSLTANLNTDRMKSWSRLALILMTCAVVLTPMMWMLFVDTAMFTFNTPYLFTGRDDLYLVNASDAEEARAYLKYHLTGDDLVLGSPALIWGLPGKNADFMTALHEPLTSSGNKSAFTSLSPDRIIYKSEYPQAAYIIFDKLALEFAPLVLPGMDHLIEDVQTNWQPVFRAGEIVIYQKPTIFNLNP